MDRRKLNEEEIADLVTRTRGWSVVEDRLHRQFQFADFREAFAFMTRVAELAETLDHHPDWSNSYNRVSIDLSTHSAGGLTQYDFELARRINDVAG